MGALIVRLNDISVQARREASHISQAVAETFGRLLSEVRGLPGEEPSCGAQAIDYSTHTTIDEGGRTKAPTVPSTFEAVSRLHTLGAEITASFARAGLRDKEVQFWADYRVKGGDWHALAAEAGTSVRNAGYWLKKADLAIAQYVNSYWADEEELQEIIEEDQAIEDKLALKLSQTVILRELRRAGFEPTPPLTVHVLEGAVCEVEDMDGVFYYRGVEGGVAQWNSDAELEPEDETIVPSFPEIKDA